MSNITNHQTNRETNTTKMMILLFFVWHWIACAYWLVWRTLPTKSEIGIVSEQHQMIIMEGIQKWKYQHMHSLATSERPDYIDDNKIEMDEIGKHENEPGARQVDHSNSDNFEDNKMDDHNDILRHKSTEGVDDQKVAFHGTKGDYYDEYNHKIYEKR
eukprot:410023_1